MRTKEKGFALLDLAVALALFTLIGSVGYIYFVAHTRIPPVIQNKKEIPIVEGKETIPPSPSPVEKIVSPHPPAPPTVEQKPGAPPSTPSPTVKPPTSPPPKILLPQQPVIPPPPPLFSEFYGFPEHFFAESKVSKEDMVKVTGAQYQSLKKMHNGKTPYTFAKIEYDPPVYGATTPQGIRLGDSAFPGLNSGHPRWEVMAHEQGHNFFGGTSAWYSTLAVPGPFLQESLAVLSAFYTFQDIVANQNMYIISQPAIESLSFDFGNGRKYQEGQYNQYVANGKKFNMDDVLTSQALDYKMIVYGEQYGWQNYTKLTKVFEDSIASQFTFQQNGVSATERSTYIIAALGAAFSRDFRTEFRDLNFPIDDVLYSEIHPKIQNYILQ